MTEALSSNRFAWARLCRPGQWVKNGFVLAPLLFGRQFSDATACAQAVLATLCFCLVSSAVYVFNDLCDREQDRRHPAKQHRPLASGAVSLAQAMVLLVVLIGAAVLGLWRLPSGVALVVALYGVSHGAYSLLLKRLVILDVMVIAAGFVLRILGGAAAVAVLPSHWLVLCTIFISLYLGFTKRRAELVANHAGDGPTRHVLKHYSKPFLDQLITLSAGITIVCYALYTVDEHTQALFGGSGMLLTLPCVIYGLFRYMYLTFHLTNGEDPTAAMLRDAPMIINLLIWLALCWLVVQHGERLALTLM